MRKPRLLLALFLLCLTHLVAEDIQLRDGTKVSGKVVGVKNDTFEIQTSYGLINVPRSDVITISFPENQPSASNTATPVMESLTGTTYVNRTGNFRAVVPNGWRLAPEMRRSKDIVAALKSPDGTLFFLVTPEVFAGNLATYKVLAETQYKSKFTDYEKVTESEVEIDGRTGVRMVFHGKMDKATTWTWCVFILPYEGRVVRLSFLTLEPLFNDAVPVFERIAASYHSTGAADLALK